MISTSTSISAKLMSRLRDLARAQNGMAAVEFAVILPFMLTAYIGGVEIGDGVAIDRKVAITTRSVADLASRYTTIKNADMSTILGATSAIIQPYGSAPLTVTSYTRDDWMAGNQRYNDGVPFINPFADAGGQPPGGFTVPSPSDPSPLEPTDGTQGPACTNCHGPGSSAGIFEGIDWTPEQTAGFSDQQLVDIIVNGIIPDGGYYDSTIISYQYWQFFHRWRDLTPDQQTGIVVYLRSLVSAPQSGMVDFGGALESGGTASDAGTPDGAADATPDATPE